MTIFFAAEQRIGHLLAGLVLCTLSRGALAAPVVTLYEAVGDRSDVLIEQCSVAVSAREMGSARTVFQTNADGLGVGGGMITPGEGGPSNERVDSGESLIALLPRALPGVGYTVSVAVDGDSDQLLGESVVELFDVGSNSLGAFPVSGSGFVDLSALVDDTPIARFEITAVDGDSLALGSIEYEPDGIAETRLDFTILEPPLMGSAVTQCAILVTGSANLTLTADGVGVAGGAGDGLDSPESMNIFFQSVGGQVLSIGYDARNLVQGDNMGGAGGTQIQAFGPGSIGVASFDANDALPWQVSAAFGSVRIDGLTVTSSPGDSHSLGELSFVPEPGQRALALATLGSLFALARVRRGRVLSD